MFIASVQYTGCFAHLISFTVQYCFLISFCLYRACFTHLISSNGSCNLCSRFMVMVQSMINWSTLVKLLMQTYIIIVLWMEFDTLYEVIYRNLYLAALLAYYSFHCIWNKSINNLCQRRGNVVGSHLWILSRYLNSSSRTIRSHVFKLFQHFTKGDRTKVEWACGTIR